MSHFLQVIEAGPEFIRWNTVFQTHYTLSRYCVSFCGKSVRSWCDGSSDRSFMVNPLSYILFQPVYHDWCNNGCGMCYPVCGMVHIKYPLLLIGKRSPCGGSRFPLLLSEWFFTICPTPYNRIYSFLLQRQTQSLLDEIRYFRQFS